MLSFVFNDKRKRLSQEMLAAAAGAKRCIDMLSGYIYINIVKKLRSHYSAAAVVVEVGCVSATVACRAASRVRAFLVSTGFW